LPRFSAGLICLVKEHTWGTKQQKILFQAALKDRKPDHDSSGRREGREPPYEMVPKRRGRASRQETQRGHQHEGR